MNLNKEMILAIILGFGLGLLTAFLVWYLPNLLPKTQTPQITLASPVPAPDSEEFFLTVSQPENEAVLTAAPVTVFGKTTKGSTVVISGPLEDKVIEATGDGVFNSSLNLEEGENEIMVTSYNTNGQQKSETRTVFYTKEEF